MLKQLKQLVYEQNMELWRRGLVLYTWGNVSGIDRESGIVVIKPSGVDYDVMKPEDMVAVLLETGEKVEGDLNPSSDTPTHLVLYRAFENIGGVVHTHSTYATAFAQAGRDIPCMGTTHADYFRYAVPSTRQMTKEEIAGAYEAETGNVMVECFRERGLSAGDVPAVLVDGHGPFAWGKDPAEAVYHAVVLEEVARMASISLALGANPGGVRSQLSEKHFLRKHGKDAYYGQKK